MTEHITEVENKFKNFAEKGKPLFEIEKDSTFKEHIKGIENYLKNKGMKEGTVRLEIHSTPTNYDPRTVVNLLNNGYVLFSVNHFNI